MAYPMYWVTALTCAISLALILVHDRNELDKTNREENAFQKLILWVLYFCLQDAVWGICASTDQWGNIPLFAASTLFHSSTVLTTYFWLNYVLIHLDYDEKRQKIYKILDAIVIAFQFAMLAANLFVPTIFSVRDGLYCTEILRPLAFFNQYVVYLTIGILMLIQLLRAEGDQRRRYLTVFCFALAPILTGVFQLLYPDAPFYTIGYFLGTIIIHLFIVQNARAKLHLLHHEMENQANRLKIAEQIALSNTDILTGLPNRRAYEEAVTQPCGEGFVYLSVDVNELKRINDNLGHAAGDELLMGAAACLQSALADCGTVFRIGGDEFAALLQLKRPLGTVLSDLQSKSAAWKGQHVEELSLSCGAATLAEFPGLTAVELAKVADDRMYADKTAYYLRKGIDRRGMHTAYAALCASYEKILRVNLTNDSFQIIAINGPDILDFQKENSISQWLYNFGVSGMVHPDDLPEYLRQTERKYLQAFFSSGREHFTIFYRRRGDGEYYHVMMEILPAEDFTPDNQQLYLYVKRIDRFV